MRHAQGLLAIAVLSLSACVPQPGGGADPEGTSAAQLNDPTAPSYPADQAHSPLTADVIDRLRALIAAGSGKTDLFSKIGDSITVDHSFARCLAADPVQVDSTLAAADEFADETNLEAARAYFAETQVGGTTSFDRTSLSATIGWMTIRAIQGEPDSALDHELDATDAAFAVVMLGTNDTEAGSIPRYRTALTRVVDRLIARNVVPILSTIPPQRGSANQYVPGMNAVVRTIAEQRRIPLMDFWLRLSTLQSYGIGSDTLHPTVSGDGCAFSRAALTHGYNQRNLLLIEALDRMKRFVLDGANPDTGSTDLGTGGTDSSTPTPPVNPTPTPTPSPAGGTCDSYTLGVPVPLDECVQSIMNQSWYRCTMDGWVLIASPDECAITHPL